MTSPFDLGDETFHARILIGNGLGSGSLVGCGRSGGGRAASVAVGVHRVLDEAGQAAPCGGVLGHRPCDVGLGRQLWTRRLVGELVAKLYRVRLAGPGVGEYLKRWGLSFQRPDKRAAGQDPEGVRRWHEETWPAIRAKAEKDGGGVPSAGRAGIPSGQVTGRTWGGKGRTLVVRRSGNRFAAGPVHEHRDQLLVRRRIRRRLSVGQFNELGPNGGLGHPVSP